MALDKSDPFGHLPRRSMFASTVAPQAEPMVPQRQQPKPVAPQLRRAVEAITSRKRGEVKGKPLNVRLQPATIAKLEAWAKANDAGSLPEAIRRLIEAAL